jgi:hypothetical protein
MTNSELLGVLDFSLRLENAHYDKESKYNAENLLLACLAKNQRMLQQVEKERTAIDDDIKNIFKKENDFDEKNQDKGYIDDINAKYREFRKEPTNVQVLVDFLEKESHIELYKVRLDVDTIQFPKGDRDLIEKYFIITE